MDELVDQAGSSHWASRTEALERLLQLLTVEGGGGGGGGDAGPAAGEGGRFVLESRPASRRLEAVIAERARDANFRVVAAALRLLEGLVGAHPALMTGHVSALLPSVSQVDVKEMEKKREDPNVCFTCFFLLLHSRFLPWASCCFFSATK